jgi:hypothetical protein
MTVMVVRLALRQLATANLRTAEWGLYADYRGNTNLLRCVITGTAFSFTPEAASTELVGFSGVDLRVEVPGGPGHALAGSAVPTCRAATVPA